MPASPTPTLGGRPQLEEEEEGRKEGGLACTRARGLPSQARPCRPPQDCNEAAWSPPGSGQPSGRGSGPRTEEEAASAGERPFWALLGLLRLRWGCRTPYSGSCPSKPGSLALCSGFALQQSLPPARRGYIVAGPASSPSPGKGHVLLLDPPGSPAGRRGLRSWTTSSPARLRIGPFPASFHHPGWGGQCLWVGEWCSPPWTGVILSLSTPE